MCCTNGVGQALITDANGNVIFEGDPMNLQNFTEIGQAFHTGSSLGAYFRLGMFTIWLC